jgi:hypothetical protein
MKNCRWLSKTMEKAPPVGLEPTTDWLTASRSTTLSYGGSFPSTSLSL